MLSSNFSLPFIASSASVGRAVSVKKQGISGYTVALGQERRFNNADMVSIAFAGRARRVEQESGNSHAEDSDDSVEENLHAIPEHPHSILRTLVRNVVSRFGKEKTQFPKGNPANARGKQRPEVQNAISEASKILNRLPSIELAEQVGELQRIVEEEAPGNKSAKGWFNRDSLGLSKGGSSRNKYYGTTRAQEVIPQEEQALSRQFDEYITNQDHAQTPNRRERQDYLRRSHKSHASNLGKLYDQLKRQGLLDTPQEQQAYRQAEEARQGWLTDRVVSRLPGNPVNDFFDFELQTNAPSPNREYQNRAGNRIYPIISPAGRFVGWSRDPQLRGG